MAHYADNLHVVRVADGLSEAIGIAAFATHQLPQHAAMSAAELGLDDDRVDYYELQLTGLAEQLEALI